MFLDMTSLLESISGFYSVQALVLDYILSYLIHKQFRSGDMDSWLLHMLNLDVCQCGMSDHQSLRSACAYAQSGQSLCLSLNYSVAV